MFPYAATSAVSSVDPRPLAEDALPLTRVAEVRPPEASQKYKDYNHRGDIVRSVEASIVKPLCGDLRALSLVSPTEISANEQLFSEHPFYRAFQPEKMLDILGRSAIDPAGSMRRDRAANYNYRFAQSLRNDENVFTGQFGTYITTSSSNYTNGGALKGTFLCAGSFLPLPSFLSFIQRDAAPSVPTGLMGAYIGGDNTLPGDWDAGLGVCSDGPFINLPDQGNSSIEVKSGLQAGTGGGIYGGYFGRGEFTTQASGATAAATFSPNRQIASAVAFGSLSTGVDPQNPGLMEAWRTLLFCANPAAGSRHPGFGKAAGGGNPYPPYSTPPDHAFLDFFTMPIVEGYPISEPMSTAGKINMNYQIAPFTYIHRSTGIRAVMKKVCISAVPGSELVNQNSDNAIKSANTDSNKSGWQTQVRYGVNLDEKTGTLKQFEQRFEKGDLFRSASEICDMFLVPKRLTSNIRPGYTTLATPSFAATTGEINFSSNSVANWWKNPAGNRQDYSMTADNLRETPYGHIYPRLTTKSNSYTVHVRVQTLTKNFNTPPSSFVDPKEGWNDGYGDG